MISEVWLSSLPCDIYVNVSSQAGADSQTKRRQGSLCDVRSAARLWGSVLAAMGRSELCAASRGGLAGAPPFVLSERLHRRTEYGD